MRNNLTNFGNAKLEDIPDLLNIKTKFLIMSFDYDKQRNSFFRSDYKSMSSSDSGVRTEITLAEAVHASSNAPVNYFDEPAQFTYQGTNRRFWDGGVSGNNNPVLAGLTEAMANGNKPEDILVLSIGTGSVMLPLSSSHPTDPDKEYLVHQPEKQSLQHDVQKLAVSILQDPPDAATYISHIMLGGDSNTGATPKIVRLNPLIQPFLENGKWVLPPDFKDAFFEALVSMDMDAVLQDDVSRILYLGEMWLADKVKNQPIRTGKNFVNQIGHPFFSEGKKAWLKLTNSPENI